MKFQFMTGLRQQGKDTFELICKINFTALFSVLACLVILYPDLYECADHGRSGHKISHFRPLYSVLVGTHSSS